MPRRLLDRAHPLSDPTPPASDDEGTGGDPIGEAEEQQPLPAEHEQQPMPEQEQAPPLWPDQVVAWRSFETYRNEGAYHRAMTAFLAANDAAEEAAIKRSLETAELEDRARTLMAAERAVYEQLNSQAASAEQQRLIAQAEDAAERAMAPERRAQSSRRCKRKVRGLSVKANDDDQPGPSGGA